MLESILEALIDTAKLLPLLYLAYLLIDFIDKKASNTTLSLLFVNHFAVVMAALCGCVPQCSFSVFAASLYASGVITKGTLVACFIATSDEALPLFLTNPSQYSRLGLMIICKVVIAIIAGYIIDLIYPMTFDDDEEIVVELDGLCNCNPNYFMNALTKTINTGLFILIVNVIFSIIFYFGETQIVNLLSAHTYSQTIICTSLGFFPNCAMSVILVELNFKGAITFGSMIAGLCTGAGLGMAVLFEKNKNLHDNMLIMGYLFTVALISGIVINLVL